MQKIKIRNVLFNVFIIITIILAAFVGTMLVTQTRAFSVSTDSMFPELKTGDVVFVRPAAIEQIQADDIVTIAYIDNSGYFTHRVVRVDLEQGLIYTKGDANEDEDPYPSSSSRLVGKMWFKIPYLGQISLHIYRNTLLIIIASVAGASVVGRVIIVIIKKSKKRGDSYEK